MLCTVQEKKRALVTPKEWLILTCSPLLPAWPWGPSAPSWPWSLRPIERETRHNWDYSLCFDLCIELNFDHWYKIDNKGSALLALFSATHIVSTRTLHARVALVSSTSLQEDEIEFNSCWVIAVMFRKESCVCPKAVAWPDFYNVSRLYGFLAILHLHWGLTKYVMCCFQRYDVTRFYPTTLHPDNFP